MMNEIFFNWLAKFIVSRPDVLNAVIGYGRQRPYADIIHDKSQSLYMGRWWLMPRFLLTKDENGDDYPYGWLPFIIRLHHICRPDGDRDLHDHPGDYRTIILKGWYWERDIYGRLFVRHAGDTVASRAEKFHTISKISEGGVWTMFIMWKKRNDWGFLVGGRKVPHRLYRAGMTETPFIDDVNPRNDVNR